MSDSPRVVSVEIHGQKYSVRSHLDPAYVMELAAYLDEKMQQAAEELRTGDSVRVAVLAALNVVDEYFRARQADRNLSGQLIERAEQLERLVDRALSLAQ